MKVSASRAIAAVLAAMMAAAILKGVALLAHVPPTIEFPRVVVTAPAPAKVASGATDGDATTRSVAATAPHDDPR